MAEAGQEQQQPGQLPGATTPPDGTEALQEQQAEQKPDTEATGQEGEGKENEEQRKSRSARRLDRWRTRAIEAETRYKVLQEQRGTAPAAEVVKPASDDGSPKREQFDSYEAFMEAKAGFVAEKKATEAAERLIKERTDREQADKQRETTEKTQRDWMKQVDAARDDIEDFDEVCAESEAPVTAAMSQAILESDKGARIAYYLAQHPEEADKIAKLTPGRQTKAIFDLEDKVAKASRPASKAPDPINPVSGKGASDPTLSTTDPRAAEKLSTAEWMKREEARMMAKAKAAGSH